MPQDSQTSPLTYTTNHAPAHPSGRVGSGVGDEAHLVDDMCTPGGLRAQPDREDLRHFVESAASLDGTAVAELLQAKMVCMPSHHCCRQQQNLQGCIFSRTATGLHMNPQLSLRLNLQLSQQMNQQPN